MIHLRTRGNHIFRANGISADSSFRLDALAMLLTMLALAGLYEPARAQPVEQAPITAAPDRPIVILVGLDGFRANAWKEVDAPNFRRIAKVGVSSELVPVFPSLSFPNLWTLVTGLYPDKHGIVANSMYDPRTGKVSSGASFRDPSWWGGEPIWVTAERQGHIAATTGWIGSEAKAGGDSPTFSRPYADTVPLEVRVDEVLAYLDLPPERRPSLITFYSDWIDNNGHIYGPGSTEELNAMRDVDRALGRMLDGLTKRGLQDRVNLVIVADHGMMPITPERRIVLDDYLDLNTLHADAAQGGIAYLWPKDGDVERVRHALQGRPGFRLYRREGLPVRFHLRDHSRVPPLVAVAEAGWNFSSRSDDADAREAAQFRGMHGYDNQEPGMRALFLATGPAFRRNAVIPRFSSTEVAALVATALKITPHSDAARLSEAKPALAPVTPTQQ